MPKMRKKSISISFFGKTSNFCNTVFMIKKYQEFITQHTELSAQEACWLLQHITQKSQAELLTTSRLSDQELEKLDHAILQIKNHHKPLAYILGFVPFLDLKIQVKAPILIPRHETEEWVAKIIEQFQPLQAKIKNICDLGTGSGCIALALAKNFPQADITAIDINPQALDLAAHNAQLNNIKNITFLQSDLFDQLPKNLKFDLIVSNPPYIDPACRPQLPVQVLKWEDHQALFAQDSGLHIITKILQNSVQFLQKNSTLPAQLVFEIDHDQHEEILKRARLLGWQAQTQQDSFKKWRTMWCKQD
jgi:release factor glutamine methyltransferase